MKWISTLLAGSLVLLATSSWALSLGTNITIPDGTHNDTNAWYGDHEDQEVEPGMSASQAWDLEAFLLDGYWLSIVGGYNFKDGQDGLMSGDIFIDIDGVYGGSGEAGNEAVQNNFGYEYVLALTFGNGTMDNSYTIFELKDTSYVYPVAVPQNAAGTPNSNPWRYANEGVEKGGGQFTFSWGLGDTDVTSQTFQGGTHYAISGFDLSFLTTIGGLNHGDTFTTHFTMECGNDNLMGQGSVVPEPASLLLLGTGLIGLAGIGRRRTKHDG